MNKEIAKRYLPIIQALADGETIQFYHDGNNWCDTSTPYFEGEYEFRIKPKLIVRWIAVYSGVSNRLYSYDHYARIDDCLKSCQDNPGFIKVVRLIEAEE